MLNIIVLMGRLVRDPEIRTTQGGNTLASFTLAVERDFAPQGQEKETDFINCTAWGGTANFIGKYFAKGALMSLRGALYMQNYTDRDGNKRTAANVNVENVYFAEKKRSEKSGGDSKNTSAGKSKNEYSSKATPKQTFEEMEDASDDELPF